MYSPRCLVLLCSGEEAVPQHNTMAYHRHYAAYMSAEHSSSLVPIWCYTNSVV